MSHGDAQLNASAAHGLACTALVPQAVFQVLEDLARVRVPCMHIIVYIVRIRYGMFTDRKPSPRAVGPEG